MPEASNWVRTASVSSGMISLTEPTIGTSAVRFLEISAGSMSAWMTLAFGRKGLQDAGDAVIKAGAQGDQEVRLLQGGHGRDRAVHAGHADVLRVRVREHAAGHQGGDHRARRSASASSRSSAAAWALTTPPPT